MENSGVKLSKKELVEKLASNMGMSKSQTEYILSDVFNELTAILAQGYTVSIPNFGKFIVYNSDGYKGRNPATGEPVDVPPKRKIKFKPSNNLKSDIQ